MSTRQKLPKISVIIPAYNCSAYIEQALRSIQAQTLSDWEVIVVDDGSHDETALIVETMSRDDARIRLLRQKPSGKPAVARNTGLGVASGEFICFLDADDYYPPNKLACCLASIECYPHADLVFHDVEYVDEQGNTLPGSYLERCQFTQNAHQYLENLKDQAYRCCPSFYFFLSTAKNSTILPSSVMMRSNVLHTEEIFSSNLIRGEDLDLWLRLLANGVRFLFLNKVLSYYRRHGNNLTAQQPQIDKDRIKVHESNYQRTKNLFSLKQRVVYRRYIAEIYANGGFGLLQGGGYKEAQYAFFSSFLWYPNWFALKQSVQTQMKSFIRTVKFFLSRVVSLTNIRTQNIK